MALLDLLNSKGSVYTKPSTIQYQQKTKVVGLLPKSSLDLNGKKSVKSNTISLKNDDIKIGTFTFSKRHFLTNAFFVNKVTKEYVNIFSDKYWIKLIQNLKDDGELIIMLDINHKKEQKNINI